MAGKIVERDVNGVPIHGWDSDNDLVKVGNRIWNPSTLSWEAQTGGGGTGSEVEVTNFPATQAVSNPADDVLAKYRPSDIDDAGDPAYYGFLAADGAYYIMRHGIAAKQIRYTAGASGYATAWTNRATETYDLFSEVF